MKHLNKTVSLPGGKEISIEVGRLARQANGAAVIRCGDTMLLATVVASKEARAGVDFLPLSVDYVEKYAASGKIPGGFFKREGRLGEGEILTSRLVDRALRPLFPKDFHNDVQVIIQLISADREEQPDALACFAASTAILCSDLPFADPVSEVRVIQKDGEFLINPTFEEMDEATLDIIVAATNDSIVMVEGEMNEVSEETLLEAMKAAHEAIRSLNSVQLELRKELALGMMEYEKEEIPAELVSKVRELSLQRYSEISHSQAPKQERSDQLSTLKDEVIEQLTADLGEEEDLEKVTAQITAILKDTQKEVVRNMILDESLRLDGRTPEEVRSIWSEVSYMPRSHGSAIFTRGETQSLCSVTLGTKLDEQTLDGAVVEGSKRFILHYNFPPFSTGEARFLRGPGRREIGHGNLAERALKVVVPKDYDYTIRVVSEILESNGSSSMASVCGGCLALMDAGVPVKGAVSGIAMGLITDTENNRFAVLSDILGDEDFLGDMDFKVAGTRKGLTACQMDIKIRGLSYEILEQALGQSKAGRLHILDKMLETIDQPREDISNYAPRIGTIEVPGDMIGAIIGPGGKIIQEIQRETQTTINLEEEGDKGIATIYSPDKESIDAAMARIKQIIALPEVGETYLATVKAIKDFGAFVEFMPGKEGLLHISEIAHERLPSMDGVLSVGDELEIKIVGIDEKSGKFRLSRKVLLPVPEGFEERPPRRDNNNRGRNNRNGGGHNRDRNQNRGPRRNSRDD